ncbi:hypothetical protein [Taibaiella koreensis]|uniref:hypothetical protein n=1 Tax=Taibaiella koreensis TaxID=1268548 RepID=UPI0013C36CD8|nr:hypothetical protein [Taibaiella koreensis]
MKKILMCLCLFMAGSRHSQAQIAEDFNAALSKERTTQLFQLNTDQYNNHFDFKLPNDGKLYIDFLRLSDWGEKNQLKQITDIAADQVKFLKDSFSSSYSTKLIEINVPIDNKIIAFNYNEALTGKKQMAYKDGSYFQLKIAFDTIRVIKNVRIREKPRADSGLVQVQYTFVLKDISDMIALSEDPNVLSRIGDLADETIDKQRRHWPRQDASHHTLTMTYDPEAKEQMTINENEGFFGKRIRIFMGIGAIIYSNNAISPFFDESIAFMLHTRSRMQRYVGFNLTGFGYINNSTLRKSYVSYNLEYGLCKPQPYGFIQQRTSVALGLMTILYQDSTRYLFHMGFNFGFNSFLSSGFGFAADFKKDSKEGLLYVNFKFNL